MILKKVLTIVGTRPEAIKLAPVILRIRQKGEAFDSRVCVTGQHREMLEQVLRLFEIKPDYDLKIMSAAQTLGQITARGVQGLEGVIGEWNPDIVLVQGDTTTAFCGALAGYYHKKIVGHVEAGLRTGQKYSPFPEEVNRRLITQLTSINFAPTDYARQALLREGIAPETVHVTGNTVIDALLWMREHVRKERPNSRSNGRSYWTAI